MSPPIEIIYEQSDIPAEMTLSEYRRMLSAQRRKARPRISVRRLLGAFAH